MVGDLGNIGVDLTERPYFKHHRDNPASGFTIGTPTRSRTNGTWFIPVSQTLRRPGGEFAGAPAPSPSQAPASQTAPAPAPSGGN